MQVQKDKESFQFTYSAKEQEELKKIREKYQPREESKMDRLRKMDAAVTQRAVGISLAIGLAGSLIMGLGMSIVMTELGLRLGLTGMVNMIVGISIGVVGMILICLAYPVYVWKLKMEREKIAPEILKLTEELIK